MNNKKTWLLVESLKRATGEDRAELDYLLRGKDIKREVKIPAMQNLFRRIGIVADADKEIERLHTEARDILAGAGLDKRQLEQLSEFANILLNRER